MDRAAIEGDADEVLRRLARPFFEQGTPKVWVASCCGRLFAGEVAPVKCRVCGNRPDAIAFESEAVLDINLVPTGARQTP
jgi:rubrerythrin